MSKHVRTAPSADLSFVPRPSARRGPRMAALAVLAMAQGTAAGARAEDLELSLHAVIARAMARAPQVVAARVAVAEAEAHRAGAGLVLASQPRLSVDARPPLDDGALAHLGYGATLELLFDVAGAPAARVREAGRRVEVAAADVGVQRSQAKEEAFDAYVRVAIAGQRAEQLGEMAVIAQRVVDASAHRLALGAAGEIETSLADSELAQIDTLVADAARQREERLMELRDLIDVRPEQPVSLTTALGMPERAPPRASEGDLRARALRARPELNAIRAQIGLLRALDDRLAKEAYPRVGTYFGVDAAPLSPVFGVAGVSVELPVTNRNKGPQAATRATLAGQLERLALEERRIAREVSARRAAYESRWAELRALAERALPAAERTLALVDEGWRSGQFDLFRLTSVARDVARLRGLRLDAIEAAWIAWAALDRAAGGLTGGE